MENLKDSVSYFFLLDRTDLSNRIKAEQRILYILKKLNVYDPEIFKLLSRYITGLLQYRGLEINEVNDYLYDRREGMLAQSLDELYEDGLEKGKQEGKEEGRISAKTETLLRLIEKKFFFSQDQKNLILSAKDISLIEEALDIILFASSADDVLSVFKR